MSERSLITIILSVCAAIIIAVVALAIAHGVRDARAKQRCVDEGGHIVEKNCRNVTTCTTTPIGSGGHAVTTCTTRNVCDWECVR